jgi:hypothetical protein
MNLKTHNIIINTKSKVGKSTQKEEELGTEKREQNRLEVMAI